MMNATLKKRQRVVIIEPSAIITLGLKAILVDAAHEFEVVGAFEDLTHFQERAPLLDPDLILVDPAIFDFHKRMSVHGLFCGTPEMALVAIVHGFIEPEALKQYSGAVHIYDDGRKIVRLLRQAAENRPTETDTGDNYELTDRENEILISVAKGMTNKEIGDTHNISVHTVISHRKNITRKTGIKTVSGLTVYALLNNLIDQSEIE